jgi:hypothetical protein
MPVFFSLTVSFLAAVAAKILTYAIQNVRGPTGCTQTSCTQNKAWTPSGPNVQATDIRNYSFDSSFMACQQAWYTRQYVL